MTIQLAGYDLAIRELILGLLVLIGLYIFFVLWRVRRLKRLARQPVEPTIDVPTAPTLRVAEPPVPPPPPPPPPPKAERTLPDNGVQNAAVQEAFIRNFRNDLAQMRAEMDALRGEVTTLRGELRQEMNLMRASQTVSPIYGDAVQMATLGHDAATIAERCGIARAEAELVVALVQSQKAGV